MGHHFSSKINSNFEKFTASAINLTKKYLTCNKLNFDVKMCKTSFFFIKGEFVLKTTRVAHIESNGALVFHSKMNY